MLQLPDEKEDHVVLANYSENFTMPMLQVAVTYLKNPEDPNVFKPNFMRSVPGVWKLKKYGSIKYTDLDGNSRIIVPQENRTKILWKIWENPNVPRGQQSFYNYVSRRFIGIQQAFVRRFIGRQPVMQFITPLKYKSKGVRSLRPKKPFSHISIDLADMITFEDEFEKKIKDPRLRRTRFRYVLLLCDHYSGYTFGRRLETKGGNEVARKLDAILSKIDQDFNGEPKVCFSDLGLEFHNNAVKIVFQKHKRIKHLKPFKTKIAPFIENRVRTFKRHIRLLSHLLFKNDWWGVHTIKSALNAMNNIQRKDGYTPLDIITHFKNNNEPVLQKIRSKQRIREATEDKSFISIGDRCRIRVAPQKLPFNYKAHLGFVGQNYNRTITWSKRIFIVTNVRHYATLKKHKYKVNDRKKVWYDHWEILKIPENTMEMKFFRNFGPDKSRQNRAKNIRS